MSLVVDEHREYLADAARVGAYRTALNAVVRPGDVGLDLASGTGILGLLACQAGASRIYAIESGQIASLAPQLAHENGCGDRIIVINEQADRATLPERVDFVVTDMAGRFGFEAGLFELMSEARRRFLKPGGRIIPNAVSLWLAPIEAAEVRQQVDFWAGPIEGFTFAAAHRIAISTGYPRHLDPSNLLAAGTRITGADLNASVTMMNGRAAFAITRTGVLHAIGGWFGADLGGGVELTNAPGRADRINRRNVCFPLRESVPVETGDIVNVAMVIRPSSLIVRWIVDVVRNGTTRHHTDTSTFQGMLMSRSEVDRMRPDFVPVLTEPGRARRTVVDLCDGTRSLREIEQLVFERHGPLFAGPDEAAAFVAEVVSRYAI